MHANTTTWGTTRTRAGVPTTTTGARRLARALAAFERWAEHHATTLAAPTVDAHGEAWADGAQSAFSEVAARVAQLREWLLTDGAASEAFGAALLIERAWLDVEGAAAAAEADNPDNIDLERLHALGRSAALTVATRRLSRVAQRWSRIETSRSRDIGMSQARGLASLQR